MSAIADINRAKTHCKYGHPLVEGNVLWFKRANGRMYRACAECRRRVSRAHPHNKQETEDERLARQRERKRRFNQKHPEKRRAYGIVHEAVKKGRLIRPESCQRCFKTNCRIEASHDDYSKPLEVEWLCRQCHAIKDRKHKLASDPPPAANSAPAGIGAKI